MAASVNGEQPLVLPEHGATTTESTFVARLGNGNEGEEHVQARRWQVPVSPACTSIPYPLFEPVM